MSDREVLSRIDAHIAQGNELMARNREAFEANREAFEANREALARHAELHQDLRHFIQQITRRIEVSISGSVAEQAAGRQVLVQMDRHLRDLHEETYAQRQAIWTMIDEIRRHGLGPASG